MNPNDIDRAARAIAAREQEKLAPLREAAERNDVDGLHEAEHSAFEAWQALASDPGAFRGSDSERRETLLRLSAEHTAARERAAAAATSKEDARRQIGAVAPLAECFEREPALTGECDELGAALAAIDERIAAVERNTPAITERAANAAAEVDRLRELEADAALDATLSGAPPAKSSKHAGAVAAAEAEARAAAAVLARAQERRRGLREEQGDLRDRLIAARRQRTIARAHIARLRFLALFELHPDVIAEGAAAARVLREKFAMPALDELAVARAVRRIEGADVDVEAASAAADAVEFTDESPSATALAA